MLEIEWMGRLDYQNGWDLQNSLVSEREKNSNLNDRLLLLEHPPTYTLGRHGHMENLLLDQDTLDKGGFSVYRVNRGGDITYHGPGQLVGYPILNLERLYGAGIGRIRQYVNHLESVLIQVLRSFSIESQRFQGHRGVWVSTNNGMRKVAAIGIHVTGRGISSHGFALNVDPDLSHFDGIIPCGIKEFGVTSMSQILGTRISLEEVLPFVIDSFTHVLSLEVKKEIKHYVPD
jgi:lipoate-protein ligase B